MKRKSFAALSLLMSVSMTACTGTASNSVSQASVQQFSDKDVEARIASMKDNYDGFYVPDVRDESNSGLTDSMLNIIGSAFNSNEMKSNGTTDAMVIADTAEEAAPDEEDTYVPEDTETFDPVLIDDTNWNTEGYNYIKENGFISVKTQPFSTFSADVDTATYSSLRKWIFDNDNEIPQSAIRIEEMINYFNYSYDEPTGDDKFSVRTSLAKCPWNEDTLLLRVGVRAQNVKPESGSNIVFLIDTSGSMFDNNKLPLAQKAFNILQENLTEKDRISIVTYTGNEEVVAEGLKGSEHGEIKKAVDSLEAWGSTNGEGGINKAYEIAEKYFIEGGNNRVILATDGDFNVGVSSESGLIELIEDKKKSGIMLSCLGFGEGNYQDDKMESLADHGNGNYSYIDCTAEAEKVLKDELWSTLYTVAKDTKFQIEFNPALVKGYRQVGYENRQMAAEDFSDDTKDGGEVGSNQTVTVLYEIATADSDFELPSVPSKYGNNDTSDDAKSDELLTVSIRYKEPADENSILTEYPVTKDMVESEMDDDTSWAAGVAQVGMLLRDSEFKGTSSYEDVYERLKKNPDVMEDDMKAQFLYLVKTLQERESREH